PIAPAVGKVPRMLPRLVDRLSGIENARLPTVLFAWVAIFLIGAKFAYLASHAEFWSDGRLTAQAYLRAVAYPTRDLLIGFALCLALWIALQAVRGRWARRLLVGLAVAAAGAIIVLGLVSAATLPVLGSPLTA